MRIGKAVNTKEKDRLRMRILGVATTVVGEQSKLRLVQTTPWPAELQDLEAAAQAVLDLYLTAPHETAQHHLLKDLDIAGLSRHLGALDKVRQELSLAEQGMDQIGYAEAQRDRKPRLAKALWDIAEAHGATDALEESFYR